MSELHGIAQAARSAQLADADAELVERVCWAAVPRIFATRGSRAGGRGVVAGGGATLRVPPRRRAPRQAVERLDWKARAAGM